ncbi:hypothetical protein QQ045_009852 [Rhodiola kirilowii]
MDRSVLDGFMAVVAASGSVVFLALQVHKRLLSDFMKKLELEIGPPPSKIIGKKSVRFAANLESRKGSTRKKNSNGKVGVTKTILNPNYILEEIKETMPPNRLALYKGIIEFKNLKGHKGSTVM